MLTHLHDFGNAPHLAVTGIGHVKESGRIRVGRPTLGHRLPLPNLFQQVHVGQVRPVEQVQLGQGAVSAPVVGAAAARELLHGLSEGVEAVGVDVPRGGRGEALIAVLAVVGGLVEGGGVLGGGDLELCENVV